MRICLLSSGHPPNDDRIFYKEARSFTKICDDVWIISPHSSDITYKKEEVNFLSIPTYSRNWFGRFRTIRELYKVALSLDADVYHCHEPESLLVATKLKKALGCKIVFDSHEMYSATLAQMFPKYLHNQIMYAYKLFERAKINQCDFVIGATCSITDYLKKIVGSKRTETILNCTSPDIFGEVRERKWDEETIICHDGNLTFSRGLKTMVKAVKIVKKKYPVKFKIVGDVFGPEKDWLESYMKTNHMEDIITRTGWLDYRDVGPAISECHIGLLALEKLPNHIIAAPNKIFNYMYFGMPFVTPDYCIDIKKLIEEEKCGVITNSNSAEDYANAITCLLENREKTIGMGLNAKKASETKYNWPIMERKLFNIYKKLESFC